MNIDPQRWKSNIDNTLHSKQSLLAQKEGRKVDSTEPPQLTTLFVPQVNIMYILGPKTVICLIEELIYPPQKKRKIVSL